MIRIPSIIFSSCAASLLLTACAEAPKPVSAQRSMPVQVISVQYQTVPVSVELPGSVQPRHRITLSSQINGFVASVRAQAGDLVSAGQTLVTLDARDARSQKDMAQASVEEAQAGLEQAVKSAQAGAQMRDGAKANAVLASSTFVRFQKLFDSKSVSPQELDEARSRRDAAAAELAAKESMVAAEQDHLKQLQARIRQAGAQSQRADILVGWTVVQSPVAARVAERAVDPGSAIFPGSPLLVLETSTSPQIWAEIAADQLAALRVGMEVSVRVSDPGSALRGRVAEIVPRSSPGTHTVQFKVDLLSGTSVPTGSYARVEVPAGSRKALLVPIQAVRATGQLTGLFVVDSGSKARFRLVKTAPCDADRIEVLSGIEPGDRIVSPIPEALSDGLMLEVRS